ncbi:hypothetical protein VC83_07495 [Pseudogymnoascus destructans]|uniref:YDG domain-containing protein n=2 Tax=Pseudogymnoascus destructans TaxID=655981 RepID=L8FZX5_PSED2|nr:uncharacterized protein VC83_07495 [Pseudogymnoascus destructans]ELR06555.1 hypothetical protein GMDG_02189 [Pseudogymnoascus destructans 20631-21]OAF56080.1 hypothetical protein VC83_07495 [Pseudogymnoascus destructans]
MGVLELLEKNRTEARERRMALIAAEDAAAAAVKKEYSPTQAVEPKQDSLRQIKPTYSGLKPAKRRKITGPLNDKVSESPASTSVLGRLSASPGLEDAVLNVKIPESSASLDVLGTLSTPPDSKDAVRYGPGRKAPRKKAIASYTNKQAVDTRIRSSEWYEKINMREKYSRGDLQSVAYLRTLCHNYVSASHGSEREKAATEIRTKLHEMEFFQCISGIIIKKSRILEDDGLPRIFDNQDGVDFPFDLRADAKALYLRWIVGDLDSHLLRGITTEKGRLESGMKRTSHRLDKKYSLKRSANVVGDNCLVNGQWWPNRICALRDGAHGEQEAGIHGQVGKGTYSVVVAQGGYADEDKEMAIEYCGTQSENSIPTKNTKLLLESYESEQPLRVLRAENKSSKFAPKKGIRYDGLYTVVEYTILDAGTAMYRFSLRRCKDQDPIRYRGPEARPTDQELKQYALIRESLGIA